MPYAIGLDISNNNFTSSCVTPIFSDDGIVDYQIVWYAQPFEQDIGGYEALLTQIAQHQIPQEVKIIMEATGVYSEHISHYLYQHGYAVYVEPPLKIHAAFYERGKTDPIDSRQIAEYGFRFGDKLPLRY